MVLNSCNLSWHWRGQSLYETKFSYSPPFDIILSWDRTVEPQIPHPVAMHVPYTPNPRLETMAPSSTSSSASRPSFFRSLLQSHVRYREAPLQSSRRSYVIAASKLLDWYHGAWWTHAAGNFFLATYDLLETYLGFVCSEFVHCQGVDRRFYGWHDDPNTPFVTGLLANLRDVVNRLENQNI